MSLFRVPKLCINNLKRLVRFEHDEDPIFKDTMELKLPNEALEGVLGIQGYWPKT